MGLFRKLIHKREGTPAWHPPAEMRYVEEIEDHFEKVYPGRRASFSTKSSPIWSISMCML